MRVRKMKPADVQLHDSTKVKLKISGNTQVVQFTAGVNKSCLVEKIVDGVSKQFTKGER